MKDGWKKETSGEERILSEIFNRGPLDRVHKWALHALPEDDDELKKLRWWNPLLRLFCLTSSMDEWWVTRRRVTRRHPRYRYNERAARGAAKP
jgi:hypothetical protein